MADGNDFFDWLPERLFESLRDQMMLGTLPSETVEELLAPCLENYEAVMDRLSPSLRGDIENILRIYPEIAGKYGLEPKPSLTSVLDALWRGLRDGVAGRAGGPLRSALEFAYGGASDIAEETQKPLQVKAAKPAVWGSATFTTDRGRGVVLECRYIEEEDRLYFRAPALSIVIHIVLCEQDVLTLSPAKREGHVDVDRLLAVFENGELPEMDIEVREGESL